MLKLFLLLQIGANEVVTGIQSAHRRIGTDRGASLVEYSLLVGLIAVVCIAAVTVFGGETATAYSEAGSSIN